MSSWKLPPVSLQLIRDVLEYYVKEHPLMAALVAVTTVLGVGGTTRVVFAVMYRLKLRRMRRQKLKERNQKIKTFSHEVKEKYQANEEECRAILSLSFSQLLSALKSGQHRPRDVLLAYQYKALEVHERTNCLVEPILEAESWAEELETTGDKKNLPLYGIPVSLKDNFKVKGYDSTIGCSKFIGKPATEDAVIVKVLKAQGAVPFVKTNIPQTMISFETSNPIFGLTVNPHDATRGAGGSSGGEGSLIGGQGSLLGIGSDIGGSIRIPSAFCGIYGFKPSRNRTSGMGLAPLLKGQTVVQAGYGPMAQDVETLAIAMKVLLDPLMFNLDTKVAPVPFNDKVYYEKRNLRIGYYTYDGFFHAVPSCQRAVREAVEALKSQGHEVVEWNFTRYAPKLVNLWPAAILGDGGDELYNLVSGDKIDKGLGLAYWLWRLSPRIKRILAAVVSPFMHTTGTILKNTTGSGSVTNWWKLTEEVQALIEMVTEDWKAHRLDAVVCPGFSCPPLPHYLPGRCQATFSYTSVYNILHFPVGTVPVSKVTHEDVQKMNEYKIKDVFHFMVKKAQVGTEGLPLAVQVVALPWQDELCLRVMKDLETALRQKSQ